MAKALPFRKRRKNGYAHTDIVPRCGKVIHCRMCGYTGCADVLSGNVFNGERCPDCRSMNFFVMESMMDKDCSWRVDEWKGCYPSSWKGTIIPEAISHPAKFSSRLIRRIYEHMQGEGWIKAGDTVLDPFGGVALGALDAMRLGLRWRGIELEQKFHDLGNGNIFHWNVRFKRMPHWSGDAVLLKGDSRKLLEVLGEEASSGQWPACAGRAAVSSPPYADSMEKKGGIDPDKSKYSYGPNSQMNRSDTRYGETDGQLGAMKAGGFEAALSSPPYADSINQNGEGPGMAGNKAQRERIYAGEASEIAAQSRNVGYGETDGQLGAMKAGGFEAALSSPPYSEARIGQESGQGQCGRGDQYGGGDGQLGAMKGDGFEAAVSSPPFEQRSADGGG